MSRIDAGELAKLRPVVVMGMHRSGTTMVAGMLRELGLFMGRLRGRNEEAIFFQRLNEWLLRRSGGAWDRPMPFLDALAEEKLIDMAAQEMVEALASGDLAAYAGRRPLLADRGLLWRVPWGFKDPRVCFTLPVWQRVFPRLRLINIRRHGVDVASSLHVRAIEAEPNTRIGLFRPVPFLIRMYCGVSRHERYVNHSVRCRRLTGAYELWEEYVASAEARFEAFDGDKLALNYEDFLADPTTQLTRLATLAGLPADADRIAAVCERVDAQRAFGFRRRPALRDFYAQVRERELMVRFGYDRNPGPSAADADVEGGGGVSTAGAAAGGATD